MMDTLQAAFSRSSPPSSTRVMPKPCGQRKTRGMLYADAHQVFCTRSTKQQFLMAVLKDFRRPFIAIYVFYGVWFSSGLSSN